MSQLPSIQQFEQVLVNIMKSDNDLRSQAEKDFNKTKTVPDYCISSLIKLISGSKNQAVRKPPRLTKAQQFLKQEIFKALFNETVSTTRHKLENIISALSSNWMEDKDSQDFKDLFNTLYQWVSKDAPSNCKESALNIFNQASTFLLEEGLSSQIGTLKQVYMATLKDENPKIQLAAFLSTCSLVLTLESREQKNAFAELLPGLLGVLGKLLNLNDDGGAKSCLEAFIEVNSSCSSFFKKGINNVLQAMFTIAKTKTLNEELRHLSMEFIVSLAENSPQLIKTVENFVPTLFPVSMDFMLEIEEDEDWDKVYEDNDSELTNYDVGLESLDRVANCLQGEGMQNVAFKIIPAFINNQESWKHRHAGVMAIAQTSEGCEHFYKDQMNSIVKMTLNLLNDSHKMVRYAAVHCIAQLSSDFSPDIQKKCHNMVIPGLLSAMKDKCPKVQSHAATCIVNFVETCPTDCVQPYLDAALSQLLQLLQSNTRYVQEQALSAISALADVSKNFFTKYYDHIMPYLKEILVKGTGKKERLLRARAMECVSLIAVSVGLDKFQKDAKGVMEILVKTQMSNLESDDPQIPYLQQAFGRLAKCLGPHFVPYLDYVLPALYKSASIEPKVLVSDANEEADDIEEGMESVTVSIKGVGEKRISVRTSELEDKSVACNLIYNYLFELSDALLKHVENITKLFVPLLKFPYLEEIRETAADIMPELYKAVKLAVEKKNADPKMLKQIFDYIVSSVLDALKVETDATTQTSLVNSIYELVELAGHDCFSKEQIESIVSITAKLLIDAVKKDDEIREELDDEEDEETLARLNEDLSDLMDMVSATCEFLGSMIKTNYKIYAPYFIANVWPIAVAMLNEDCSVDVHRCGLCFICDFIEEGQGAANAFLTKVIYPAAFKYAKDEQATVRHSAVYALGAAAQFCGDLFKPVAGEALKVLGGVITGKDSRSDKNASATCNAMSSLYKIARYQGNTEGVNANQILGFWFKNLPVNGDTLEAQIVHENFVGLVKSNNLVIMGERNANIPQIFKIFANIVDTDCCNDKTQDEIVALLHEFKKSIPSDVMSQIWNSLDEDERESLQVALKK